MILSEQALRRMLAASKDPIVIAPGTTGADLVVGGGFNLHLGGMHLFDGARSGHIGVDDYEMPSVRSLADGSRTVTVACAPGAGYILQTRESISLPEGFIGLLSPSEILTQAGQLLSTTILEASPTPRPISAAFMNGSGGPFFMSSESWVLRMYLARVE